MDVSIVIVSYNVADLLDKCLGSIKKETSCQYETIVVDNCSIDDSVEIVKLNHPEVNLITTKKNLGFTKANNIAFEAAQGRYVFMLNPDTLIIDNAIDKLTHFMDNHPEAGACGPKNLSPDMSLQYNCHHFPSIAMVLAEYLQLRRFFPKNKYFGREHMSYWDYNDIREVDWITGCSLFIRREVLDKIGMLDENFFLYSEECDFCYRLKENNLKTYFIPHASIVHFGGQSSVKQNQQQVFSKTILRYLLQSKYYFFGKNYGKVKEVLLRSLDISYYSISLIKNIIMINKRDRQDKISAAQLVIKTALHKK